MDLSFDKLLEQFDLKRNEHQRNMHKINKRIDEIESHMDSIKKQINNFDHQIVNLENDLKSTLSMINQENYTQSHQHNENHNQEHKEKHNHNHQEKNEHQTQQHGWAESLLNNVEEYASNIFDNQESENHQKQDNHENRSSKNAKRYKMDANSNQNHISTPEQYSASISDPDQNSNRAEDQNQITGAISQQNISAYDESFLNQSYVGNSDEQSNQGNYLDQSTLNFTNENNQYQNEQKNNGHQKNMNQLEQNYEDLSIADWEDKTTNLSMSEWFEVDPRTEK